MSYTPPHEPTVWQLDSLLAEDDSVLTWIGADESRWPISGGLAPMPGVQPGVALQSIAGPMGSFKHLDQVGARQDGVTWEDTVWDATELDLGVNISAPSPREFRLVMHRWLDSWDTRTQGRLTWYSRQFGEWWIDLRAAKLPANVIKTAPASLTTLDVNWVGRADFPFWVSFDSVSALVASDPTILTDPAGRNPPGWLPLWNRGDQPGWARFVVQGPGTFTFGDGVSSNQVIFGPVPAGVQVLITTLPRLRSIREINTGTNLYPLLQGRWTVPIPRGEAVHIPCSVTGAQAGVTRVVASLTPYRRWPE
ncbi:hypothetical protein GZH49_40130 [Nocardia terpenica]|uniref:hypothetical protein n=1 Tax=Nocardia terpenica TaxID=455432 RepID=UPI002FE0BA74